MRTRVKICGLCQAQDVNAAALNGVDAVGFVFYADSPRAVNAQQALQLLAVLPSFITSVGLFVNSSADIIEQTLAQVPVNLLQFHGNESPEFCHQFNMPYIKAVRMREDTNLHKVREDYHHGQGILVDTYQAGIPGGTGTTFDWQRIPHDLRNEIILAGGLDATNIVLAIETIRPWAVDVSGGVEQYKGVKDHNKIARLMQQVRTTY